MKIRVLLIGPLPPPMGGTTRHFLTLVEDLTGHDDFAVKVVNTSRGDLHAKRSRNLLVGLATFWSALAGVWRADVVSYHASNRGMILFGPLLVALCRLAQKPVVLRPFGGGFGDFFLAGRRVKRALMRRFLLSADVVLLQTRRAIEQLTPHARGRLVWFSTYIKPPAAPARDIADRSRCLRFVFLGHLWKAKGIETMLEAAPLIPGDCGIDVYGPTDEYEGEDIDARGQGMVRYRGLLTHEEVDARLWDYDCLLLPTFHSNEGYPGVVAEAFAHGLPVIATRWLAIPEIVDESCGILIEPRDAVALAKAMTTLRDDPALWLRLKAGASDRAAQFDHLRWAGLFEKVCAGLAQDSSRLRA